MNNLFCKTSILRLAAISLLPFTACTDMDENGTPTEREDGNMVACKITGMPYLNSSEHETEKLSEVNVFHFKGDDFILRTDVTDPYAESIVLPANGTTRIYCVSGTSLTADRGVKEADFAASTVVSPESSQSAPIFYSGTTDFTEENLADGRVEIVLTRGVARIDFANTIDANVVVNEIIVEDAPASTFVFANGTTPGEATVIYKREYAEGFRGTEGGMFTLYESTRPVHVRILGSYGDSPLNIVTTIPAVERNKVYFLQMANINSNLEGVFTIKDWEEGGSTGANPTTGHGIFIDKANSVIPAGVEVDYGANSLSVSHAGAKGMKLSFTASTKVSIATVEGEIGTVKITPNEPVAVADGYISSFNVDIEPNHRLTYIVTIHLKDENGMYNFVEIRVLHNPVNTIETVEIAGSTWMAFNATGPYIDDQIYPVDGLSVEEMYRTNWLRTVGNFFQYGRRKAYSPWEKCDPNGNSDTPRNIPWADPAAMPLPEGYHVATAKEWQMLLPVGTTIPSTYTAGNGEEIKAELITLPGTLSGTPSTAANNAKLLMRYVRFESMKTHNVLIFPICGQKTPGWDEYPGSGTTMHNRVIMWIADDRQVWLFDIATKDDQLVVTQGINRWNYDGFLSVRGIKDNN